MASTNVRREMICCICLNLYTDPVTLKCGHNFCRGCIETVLDTQTSYPYSCPQCRALFDVRPALQRNTTLCNIAEHLRSQEDGEIFCMSCIHTSVVASKTCLLCEVSLCDIHLAIHSKAPEHVLIEPTISFTNRKCSQHNKTLLYYCTEDAECLCASCLLPKKHQGHRIDILKVAYMQKKEKLMLKQGQIVQEKEGIEARVQSLQVRLRHITDKASGIVGKVRAQFQDIRMKQDNLESSVLRDISKQLEQLSLPVSDLIKQLDIRRDGLCRKLTSVEELCQMTDPLLYLQADKDDLMGDSNQTEQQLPALIGFGDLIMNTLDSDMVNIMSNLHKGYYVQEASGISLDVDTAANDVHISDDLTTASWSNVNQLRPKTPKRFAIRRVLGTRGFSTGRLYWNVEVSKEGGWRVGMTYPSISRKGKYSLIGNNNKSWGLRSFNKHYSVKHGEKEIPLACRPSCYKVRIYLDYAAGLLSFYELSDSMRHLYTYNATFTEVLYPVIVVWDNAWVRLLN